MEEEPPAPPQTQLTTVLEEARPVSVGSSQAPTADDGFFEETRARGLAALREATAYLKTTPTKATPREAPAAVVAADDALQQLASADEAERAYAAFSASLELPGARDNSRRRPFSVRTRPRRPERAAFGHNATPSSWRRVDGAEATVQHWRRRVATL